MKKTTVKKPTTVFKPKVGDHIKVVEKMSNRYTHYGIVTEVFDDMIQFFGAGFRLHLTFHEFDLDTVRITSAEKERVRFVFDQELRDMQATALKAETRFKELQNDYVEACAKRQRYFGEAVP